MHPCTESTEYKYEWTEYKDESTEYNEVSTTYKEKMHHKTVMAFHKVCSMLDVLYGWLGRADLLISFCFTGRSRAGGLIDNLLFHGPVEGRRIN